MTAPDRITLFRRIMSDEWHLAEVGETMSHANAEHANYVRADLTRHTPLAEAQIAAAVNAVWSELEDSKTQRWTLRKEHIHNAVATALRAIGEPRNG